MQIIELVIKQLNIEMLNINNFNQMFNRNCREFGDTKNNKVNIYKMINIVIIVITVITIIITWFTFSLK